MSTVIADPTPTAEQQIVFVARLGPERIAMNAAQVRDTVATYLASGRHMPTPRPGDGTDPYAPLHAITEEWLWGNVTGWATHTDRVQLSTYRAHAMTWIRGYFGRSFPELDH
jgi:hypothetical protein